MTRDEAPAHLEAPGSEKMCARNRRGVTGTQLGVKMGDIGKRSGRMVRQA